MVLHSRLCRGGASTGPGPRHSSPLTPCRAPAGGGSAPQPSPANFRPTVVTPFGHALLSRRPAHSELRPGQVPQGSAARARLPRRSAVGLVQSRRVCASSLFSASPGGSATLAPWSHGRGHWRRAVPPPRRHLFSATCGVYVPRWVDMARLWRTLMGRGEGASPEPKEGERRGHHHGGARHTAPHDGPVCHQHGAVRRPVRARGGVHRGSVRARHRSEGSALACGMVGGRPVRRRSRARTAPCGDQRWSTHARSVRPGGVVPCDTVLAESTRRASWRVDWRRDLRDWWVGLYWQREQKPYGELLSVYLCLVPCHPIVVTRLAYALTEGSS